MRPDVYPALEIGGSHVSTARVDLAARRLVPGTRHRVPLDSRGDLAGIIGQLAACAQRSAGDRPECWGIAIPGAFDFEAGIGSFAGAGKFEALDGLPLRPLLSVAIEPTPEDIAFVNDADAFLLGEWLGGAAAGERLAVGITLGTGIGSAFAEDGEILDDDPRVPPQGRADLLAVDGKPLEDAVSHRAILGRHARGLGLPAPQLDGVADVAVAARAGQAAARRALDGAFSDLGRALAPWLATFPARVLVVGGSMVGAWDLIEPSLRRGLADAEPEVAGRVRLVPSAGTEAAALLGAAHRAALRKAGGAADPER